MRQKSMLLFAVMATLLVSCGGKPGMKFSDDEYLVTQIKSTGPTTQTTYLAVIKGTQDVEIRPKVSGFITKLSVREGQTVDKGQMLFATDNSTYQASVHQTQAAVSSAESQSNTARLTYEDGEQLFKSNVIDQYELQSAQDTYATAQVAAAQIRAALTPAKEMLSFCYVKSPAAGVVGSPPLRVGTSVSASSPAPLITASNNSTMKVYFSMTERDVLGMAKTSGNVLAVIVSMPAVKLQMANGTTHNQPGRVVKMSDAVDQATGTLVLTAHSENSNRLLRSGGSGSIVIPRASNHVIVIPRSYATEAQNKIFTYTVGKDDKVKYTEAKVVPQSDGQNYIVTEGLRVGDRIITNDIAKLSDSMEIKPVTQAQYVGEITDTKKLGEIQGDYGKMKEASR